MMTTVESRKLVLLMMPARVESGTEQLAETGRVHARLCAITLDASRSSTSAEMFL